MKKLLLLAMSLLLMTAACSATKAPILNLQNQPAAKTLSMAQMEKAIMIGGSRVNWRMQKVKPGLIEATQMARSHTAVVEIPFTEKNYSIIYKSSVNLKADGDGNIHKTYNRWVRNLDKEINAAIVSESYK